MVPFTMSDVGLAILKHVVPTNDGVDQIFLKRGDVRDLLARFSTNIKESANFKLGEVKLPVAKPEAVKKKAKCKAAGKEKKTAVAGGQIHVGKRFVSWKVLEQQGVHERQELHE